MVASSQGENGRDGWSVYLYGSAITILTQQNVFASISIHLNCNINCHPYDIQLREQGTKQGEPKS